MFTPKLFTTLKDYNCQQFGKDIMAGIIVGIVALPLAIAFAIASGVSPEKGLFTAIIAGFFISILGGSRVQIGGPTGAFIVIVYGIVQVHGANGLIIATLMAGVMLLLMGFARLGSVIKYIPYPLIIGFTSGIALIIFASQVKDFLGLSMGSVPVDFIDKWVDYFQHIRTVNFYAISIGIVTIAMIQLTPRGARRIPGSLLALVLTTIIVQGFNLPVETIGSRFGAIPSSLSEPAIPQVGYQAIKDLVQPAFTIALLCGIESLLSAVVADGMIGGRHKSNLELAAQGVANIFSALFGGIPATGAIARTATNVTNGGRTPIAGIVHALTLLLIMLVAGRWTTLIPMATLSGILMVVAYNMSEWKNFSMMLKGPKNDRVVLLVTFLLTVLVDLTVAIEIGMLLAVLLFLRKMIRSSKVTQLDADDEEMLLAHELNGIPPGVVVFEITGPLFFGAAYKFKDAMKYIRKRPRVLIVRMRQVPIIDATGINTIREIHKDALTHGTKLMLSEINSEQVMEALKKARLLFAIGKANVTDGLAKAIKRSEIVLQEQKDHF